MPNSPIEWEGQEIYSGAAEDDQPHFPNHPQIGLELAGVSWSELELVSRGHTSGTTPYSVSINSSISSSVADCPSGPELQIEIAPSSTL